MMNVEVLIFIVPRRIVDGKVGEVWITKLDHDSVCGQLALKDKTKLLLICCHGWKFHQIFPL